MLPGTCSSCKEPTGGTARRGGGASGEILDTPASVEKYRDRYPGDREATFEAYVEVFFHGPTGARSFPGGWTAFSRCANAEPALVEQEPKLVARAEELMRLAGYEADDTGRPRKGRRWFKIAGSGACVP